ncbi:MAG TPA: single-stranded DNA-binding protein [Oceanipulchritudo sp.]|nr:single-stranded DNA-binding protein [Oceanipulchritudo sp.]
MAASFNKVYLMGNLTRDPEVRTTPAGLKIAKFGLAVNRRYRTRDNELKEETTFVDIDAFGAQAETLERYCQKGSPLFVEGRLRLDQWQTSNGENRSKLNVVLENFQFIGSNREGGGSGSDERSAPATQQPAKEAPKGREKTDGGDTFEEDEDIPF